MLAQDKGMRGARFVKSFVKTALPLMIWGLIVHATASVATEINGTIQLHSKSDFDVVTSREDAVYDINIGNSNEFSITAAAYSGSASVTAIATDNSEQQVSLDYRFEGPNDVLTGDQTIHVELQSPEDIEWHPEAIERPGYTKYRYHGLVPSKTISFSPPVVLRLYDGDKPVGATGPIRELRFSGNPVLGLHLPQLGLYAEKVRIEIEEGFTHEDKFLVASSAIPLKQPEIGRGTEITLISNSEAAAGVPLKMYYSIPGPHIITFGNGFDCSDLRVDGVHLLTNSGHSTGQILRIPMKWYRPFGTSYEPTPVLFKITFDYPTTYVYDVHVVDSAQFFDLFESRLSKLATDDNSKNALTRLVSNRITELSFPLKEFANEPAWYPLTIEQFSELTPGSDKRDTVLTALSAKRQTVASMELPVVSGAVPLVVTGTLVPPDGTPLGTYDGELLIKGANIEPLHIPVRYELYDSIGPAKQTFGAVIIALLTSYLGWALFDRRRKFKEAAVAASTARSEWIRDHYADLLELQQRIVSKPAQLQWNDVDADVRWLLRKQLQNVLSPEGWKQLQMAIASRDGQNVFEVFKREIGELQVPANTGSTVAGASA
jgi:hypothetical protein